ncbi:hypothetical protein AXK60_17800 [Tsukamurella pseudospumae]|uniref:HTH tetR-type domain-containing protein n=1 Tax=Tsukamurella pseudospumae TaxID=239498 RepID=A0A137ZZN8_9ACTN|nr:hypothetical protein AXK60_17800 [Tsukamurella pseudospumae]
MLRRLAAAPAAEPARIDGTGSGEIHAKDVRDTIRSSSAADFAADDPEVALRVLGLMLGRFDATNAQALRRAYQASDALRIGIFRSVLEGHGATVRRPFTVDQLSVALTALREGLHIRRLIDPAVVPDSLYGETALAIAIATLDTQHRHEHIDELGSALDSGDPRSRAPQPMLPDDPRQAVLDTAAREFAEHSFYLATLEGIAESSGVPIFMLKRLFPTKAHIVIAALRPKFAAVAQGVTDDVSLGTDHVTVIRRHLLRCARLTVEERPFMDSMIASVSHDTSGFAEGVVEIKQELHFPSLIEPVIADGQQQGLFSDGQPSTEFAAILTNALFIRCFTRRTESPENNASFVAELLLNGLRSRPAPEETSTAMHTSSPRHLDG